MKNNYFLLLLLSVFLNKLIAQPINHISSFNFPCDSIDKIVPGSGWTSATSFPVSIGNSSLAGYDAKAIARWNVVPFQDVTSKIRIGVVAFHINGINRVEFSADNGAWVSASKMTYNPTSSTWEYQVELNAVDFADGITEIRAVIYPQTAGECRVLDDSGGTDLGEKSLRLYMNGSSSLSNSGVIKYVDVTNGNDSTGNGSSLLPWRTIAKAITEIGSASSNNVSGATIRLFPGSYEYPDINGAYAEDRWLNIEGHPAYPKSAVTMTKMQGGGSIQKRVCFRHLRVAIPENGVAFLMRSSPYGNVFWADDVEGRGLGHLSAGGSGTYSSGSMTDVSVRFYTNIDISDIRSNEFPNAAVLVRNVTARNLGADFIRTNKLIVNCSVNHMRFDGGVHPDVIQVIEDIHNMIVYGLQAYDFSAQIAIGSNQYAENIALVNLVLSQMPNDPQYFWMPGNGTSAHYNHVLLWHMTVREIGFFVNSTGGTNVSIRNCMFDDFAGTYTLDSANFPGIIADHNHFSGVNTFGANATSGAHNYTNAANWDMTPAPGSPLVGNAPGNLVPVDAANMIRSVPASIGGLESAEWYNSFLFSYSVDDTICAGQIAARELMGVDTSVFNVYWNNSMIKGDTSFAYTPGTSTILPVTIQTKSIYGCASTDHTFNITVDQCLSRKEFNSSEFKLYPSVTSDRITLDGLQSVFQHEEITLQLYNQYGQLLIMKNIGNVNSMEFNVNEFCAASGLYTLSLGGGATVVTRKILFIK